MSAVDPSGTGGPSGVEIHGHTDPGWEGVRAAFADNFARRGERGAAVTVHHRGRPVVELWAGTRDFDTSTASRVEAPAPWEHGTAQVVRSATKGVAAVALLVLAERGLLDLDAPVARYWPEYAAQGKQDTLVRDVLAHRSGVVALDPPLNLAEAADLTVAADAVAAQTPDFTPGTAHGYQAHTHSWLTGELVRRVTGSHIGEWVAEHIAAPLKADLWIGLPAEASHRAGRSGHLEPPAAAGGLRLRTKPQVAAAYRDPASPTRRAFGTIDPAPDENDPAYRAAVLPASGGVMTASALSRFYAALVGEVEGGVRLLSATSAEAARTEASAGPDRVLVVSTRFGLGFMLHSPASPLLGPGSFGHPGRGGALGFADPDFALGFGYVTNGFGTNVTADPRPQALVRAVREALRG